MGDTVFYAIIIVGLVLMALWFLSYFRREVFATSAKAAAKATRGILLRFAVPRGFKVLSNVTLESGGEKIVVENMMIGYFGILLVHTLGTRGEYYGTLDAENWSLVSNNKKSAIENPVKSLEREELALRSIFAKNKIYNIQIDKITYISNKSSKTAVYVTHGGEILLGGKLSDYTQRTKFEKDAGIDVKKIADAVLTSVND